MMIWLYLYRRAGCFFLPYLLLNVLIASTGCSARSFPKATGGIMDLTKWNFEEDGEIRLDGEWNFYWNELLSPEETVAHRKEYLTLPGAWNDQTVTSGSLSENGHATFKLTVRTNRESQPTGMMLLGVHSVYKLWINGELVADNGELQPKKEQDEFRFYYHRLLQIASGDDRLHIVLQVANNTHATGGIVDSIILGNYERMAQEKAQTENLGLFVNGSLLGLGLFFFLLFIQRRDDPSYCLMAAFCLFWTVNLQCRWLMEVYPDFWFLFKRVESLSFYLTIPAILMFLGSIFPQERNLWIIRASQGAAVIFSLLAVLFDIQSMALQFNLFLGLTVVFMGYGILIITRAAIRQRRDSKVILVGMLVLVFTSLIDIIIHYNQKSTDFYTAYSLVLFAFAVSISVSRRFSRAYSDIANLSQELKQKNSALSKLDKLKDEFLANTTHELKTPLHGMIGLAEGLTKGAKGEIEPGIRQDLQLISSGGKRLANLIDDILDYSKLQIDEVKIDRQPVHLASTVKVVLETLTRLVKDKPLQLVCDISSDFPPVIADENRLQQILFNLVGNAIKFTPSGKISVSAVMTGDQVEVSVIDSGIGIPDDKLEAVFNPFERLDQGEHKSYGGTGIGLYITRQLVTLHGGEIKVESVLGKGSTFRFSLPLSTTGTDFPKQLTAGRVTGATLSGVDDPTPFSGKIPDDTRIKPCHNDGKLIFIVDDEEMNRIVLQNYLALAGLDCRSFSDGETLLKTLTSGTVPNLVLLDIVMPELSGYEVCKQIRRTYTRNELPVIMLTGNSRSENLTTSFRAGANDYITKPFSSDELLSRTVSCLKTQQGYRALKENLLLKEELESRKKTEKELIATQRLLADMLDKIDSAVVAFNESDEVSYYNESFTYLMGYSGSSAPFLGKPLSFLFSGKSVDALLRWKSALEIPDSPSIASKHEISLRKANNSYLKRTGFCQALEMEEEKQFVIVFQPGPEGPGSSNVSFPLPGLIEELNKNRQRLDRIKHSIVSSDSVAEKETEQVYSDIAGLEKSLNSINSSLVNDEKDLTKRKMAVNVMNLSLDLWQELTGLTKIELALESKIWNVYTDSNGWRRTQTLDKYLDLKTLPKFPVIKKVVATAEFVISLSATDSEMRRNLSTALTGLKLVVSS